MGFSLRKVRLLLICTTIQVYNTESGSCIVIAYQHNLIASGTWRLNLEFSTKYIYYSTDSYVESIVIIILSINAMSGLKFTSFNSRSCT